ncbi:MAG: isoprenylcysteine carboxylmethyltransferase family protein [Pseudomonadota bacterium]|nr:isoprenylcysteine carboxylmethyltransferase family protein [Pseudomonadota bacterium]
MAIPPVYFLVALLAMALFHRVFPIAQLYGAPYRYAGIVLMAGAIALVLWAALQFRRAGTPIRPFQPSTALVTSGPYLYTRNPMYLGMAGALLGAGVLMGSVTPFIVIPAFAGLINERFIQKEEALLEEKFGAAYVAYKARVRRWL